MTAEMVQLIRSHYKVTVFRSEVRTDAKLFEAPSFGEDVFAYAPRSAGAEAYRQLAGEVISHMKKGWTP